jgi:hypothetical protein
MHGCDKEPPEIKCLYLFSQGKNTTLGGEGHPPVEDIAITRLGDLEGDGMLKA